MVGVEEGQLLVAVNHVQGVIDVQGDRLRLAGVAVAPGVDHGVGQADDGLQVRSVLPARDRRLRAQVAAAVGQAAAGQLERRIAAQAVEVVGVLVAAGDGQHSRPQDRGDRMGHQGRIARVGNEGGDPIDDADPAVGQGQQRHAAIGGNAPAIEGGADFLAPHAWQIEQKTGIVLHGGRGAPVFRIGLASTTKSYSRTISYAIPATPLLASQRIRRASVVL